MKSKATVLSLVSIVAAFLLTLVATVPARAVAPIFNNQTLTIAENSPNGATTTPSKLAVFDPEGQPLTYDVLSGSGAAAFSVNASTGVVTVSDSSLLDFEVNPTFSMVVRVTDTEPQSDTATVTINLTDVSDQPPVMGDQSFSVAENSAAGTTVGTLQYSDGDTNDSHVFTVTGGSGSGLFNIDSVGKITVANGAQLNFEAVNTYNMTVEIEDEGGLTDTALITVDITNVNENPVVNPQSFTISENAANGTNVGTVAASDPEGAALTLSIVGASPFAINGNTGLITVANSSQLDFETTPSINFTVSALDPGGKTGSGTMTVNLTNVNDPPSTTGLPDVVVNEGAAPRVVNLWAAFSDDEDPDAALSFVVQTNDNAALFTSTPINNDAGTLTLNFAANGAGIANITIRAFDTTGAFTDDTFKVDINDAPTAPATQNVSVNEDAPNSQINLYDVFDDAEDADADLTYEIISVSNPALFTPPTPNITKPNLILDYAPNANGKSDIVVRATDTGSLSVQTTFKVTVVAGNDPPTTTGIANVSVQEDAPNTVIDLFAAFADNEDDDNELDYSVTDNTNSSLFASVTVNDAAGTLTLDYNDNTSGTAVLTVRAADTGGLWVETTFNVTVAGQNDAPVLTNINKNTDEDVPVSFTKNDFDSHFSDADGDPLAQVRIESLPADGTLQLGGNAVTVNQVIPAANLGSLTFVPALNWDQGSTSFNWNASDGTSYAAQPATVTITVQAKNDVPTIGDFEKIGEEGININFTAQDFINTFSDVDGDTLQKVQISSLPSHGTLKRGNNNVTINEQIDLNGLGQLRFVPDEDWSGTTSFGWRGSDGALYSAPASVLLTVNPQNDPPAIDLNGDGQGTGFNAIFVAGGQPVSITDSDLKITDIDSETMAEATIIIINRKNGAKELLSADTSGTSIQASFSAGSGVLFLTGPDTIANFEKVLRTVKYQIQADVTNPDPAQRNVSFRVNDGQDNSNDATAKVSIVNPRIEVTVTPEIQTVIKNTTAVFTVVVKNTGDVDLNNVQVRSTAVPDCNRNFQTLAAGETLPAFACIASNVTQRIDNTVTVQATDVQVGTQVAADDKAVVRVLQDIIIDIAPDPVVGDTLVKGQNAVFNVTVINPSEGSLKNVSVQAFIDYDVVQELAVSADAPAEKVPAPACNFTVGDLAAGQEKDYSCTISNIQGSFAIEVVATGTIEGIGQTEDFDIAQVGVIDVMLEVFSDPFQILAGQPTKVEFNLTLTNVSTVPLALVTLQSAAHGNLLNAANPSVSANTCPALNLSIPAGEVRTCAYEVTLILQPPAFTNSITAKVADNGGHELTVVDESIVSVANFSPLNVVLGANPSSLVAPGGAVNLTVQVTNNTSSSVTLDALNDSVIGSVDNLGNCDVPRSLSGNGTYTCTYPVTISGKEPGDVVTHVITAIADSEQVSDSVAIPITALPTVRVMLPTVSKLGVAGEPNNGVCAAMPLMANLNYFFLADDANDWYRFTLTTPARLNVRLSNYTADGQIVVFTGNCNSPTLIQNNGNYEPVKEVNMGERPAGTYYVWVLTDSKFNSTAPYTLRIEATAP